MPARTLGFLYMPTYTTSPRIRPTFLTLMALVVLGACAKPDTTAEPKPAGLETAAVALPTGPAPLSTADSLIVARADKGRIMGRDSGAMWVVMMSDFQCPYCKQWHDESMKPLVRDYVNTGKIRLAYLQLPLESIHPHARAEAEASMCASAQGKFWPYAEQLFARQKEVARLPDVRPTLDVIAKALSLDLTEFAACQKLSAIRGLVDSDIQQATQARIQSTPAFLVGDFIVEGALPYPDFRRAIDSALVVRRLKPGTR